MNRISSLVPMTLKGEGTRGDIGMAKGRVGEFWDLGINFHLMGFNIVGSLQCFLWIRQFLTNPLYWLLKGMKRVFCCRKGNAAMTVDSTEA